MISKNIWRNRYQITPNIFFNNFQFNVLSLIIKIWYRHYLWLARLASSSDNIFYDKYIKFEILFSATLLSLLSWCRGQMQFPHTTIHTRKCTFNFLSHHHSRAEMHFSPTVPPLFAIIVNDVHLPFSHATIHTWKCTFLTS